VNETEEISARKQKWEGGQVIGAAGASSAAEGYKLNDSVGVKDRMNKWSQVATVPTVASKKPVALVEDNPEQPQQQQATAPTKERLKQWEEGAAASPPRDPATAKTPVQITDSAGVKDRMNKWSEVTKDPEPAAVRKEPLKIYEDGTYQQ